MTELTEAMYAELPDPVITPAAAYEHIVGGHDRAGRGRRTSPGESARP